MQAMDTLELFEKLLRYKSITPDDDGALDFIEEYLSDFECLKLDRNGVKNRLYYKRFTDDDVHLCFAGHIDVVPAGEGWESDPFTPTINEDTIRARGTQDMKSGICAFMQALKKTNSFNGTLSLLVTSDEEGPAVDGTVIMLEYLKQKGLMPTFGVIGEPTCEQIFGDTIKIGRRGSINGLIKVKGKQGHAAYPKKAINPIHNIAPFLDKIAGVSLDSGDDDFAPSELIITDIRAGMRVTNVTPNDLELMFNVRNSTKTTAKDIEDFVSRAFCELDYELTLDSGAKSFVTNKQSKIVKAMQKSVEQITQTKTNLSTAGGTSDARFFGEYGIDVVEFGVKNDTIHAINESTSIKDVLDLEKIYSLVIENISN